MTGQTGRGLHGQILCLHCPVVRRNDWLEGVSVTGRGLHGQIVCLYCPVVRRDDWSEDVSVCNRKRTAWTDSVSALSNGQTG